jgi:hypothetical protein
MGLSIDIPNQPGLPSRIMEKAKLGAILEKEIAPMARRKMAQQ